MFRCITIIVLCQVLCACAFFRNSENEPLDPTVIGMLQPGKTTALEATRLLGGPSQVVQLGERSAYRYDHTLTKGAGIILILVNIATLDTRSDRLWLFFDSDQVLTHFGATFAGHRPEYAFPWSDLHDAADQEDKDRSREGIIPGHNHVGAQGEVR